MNTTSPLPNIVFILADDMGYGDVGCYGATKIPTPNMDRLAAEGMRFIDAHSSSAVCTPSRYSVLTGRYCWRSRLKSGVLGGFSSALIEKDRPTVASLLRDHGYATACIGKWHLGWGWQPKDGVDVDDGDTFESWGNEGGFNVDYAKPLTDCPTDHGFDYSFCIAGSLDMAPYCFIENDRTVGIPDREKDPYHNQQRKGLMTPGWKDEECDITFARKACEFIDENAGRPFFLYLPTAAPHRPCDVQPDFVKGVSQAGDRGDMVVLFDWVVGRVAEALDRNGLADNTLLIVTSDNGARATCANGQDYGHTSCGNWRGQKADIWDGGHREPFIARWPAGIAPGSINDDIVCLSDLSATCAAVVGVDIPEDAAEDSMSILPALTGNRGEYSRRETIVHHSIRGMFSVRKGFWKLCLGLGSGGFSEPRSESLSPGGPKGQLYNLADDPAETTNLWCERRDIVEELTALLDRYKAQGRSTPR